MESRCLDDSVPPGDSEPLQPERLSLEVIRQAPKVALHDHLDGGLRPQTMLEIADQVGHPLPADNPADLATWFFEAADSGTLVRYLETFDHTIAVMQRAEDLQRVAREFVEDQAADGVVYAEARWAPEQHLTAGLTMAAAIESVRDGLAEGQAVCADRGQPIEARQLVTGMRQANVSREVAELAVRYRDDSVAGFDIAGPEDGFPPSRHLDAFDYLKQHNASVTIHAGEAAGLPSIWEAVQRCGAHRVGHGVRIVDDLTQRPDGTWQLGSLAATIRDWQIPLEVCPTSNLQTGIARTYAEHPVGLLAALNFRVTISCDNRLMSGTTLSNEFFQISQAFGYTIDHLKWFTLNAAKSAFLPFDQRIALIEDQILPWYSAR